MKVIWKYTLHPGRNVIVLPVVADVLCVQAQHDEPQMWARCEPERKREERVFMVRATGEEHEPKKGHEEKYIGTFQLAGGSLVFHVFEEQISF